MVQYGSGASFQSQCPAFPPAPPGYDVWNEEENGPVPADVVAHAKSLAGDMTLPLGYSDTVYSGGVPLIVRVDPHTWTTDAQGNVVPGCYHGATVYVPLPGQPAQPSSGSSSPGPGTLFTLSLILGTVVSGLSLYEWLHRPG